jgi:hypothetical protein
MEMARTARIQLYPLSRRGMPKAPGCWRHPHSCLNQSYPLRSCRWQPYQQQVCWRQCFPRSHANRLHQMSTVSGSERRYGHCRRSRGRAPGQRPRLSRSRSTASFFEGYPSRPYNLLCVARRQPRGENRWTSALRPFGRPSRARGRRGERDT